MWAKVFIILFLQVTFDDCQKDKFNLTEEEAIKWMEEYNTESQVIMNKNIEADWNYNVNINEENKKIKITQEKKLAEYSKRKVLEARNFDYKTFQNATLKRLFQKLVILKYDGLNEDDFIKLHQTLSDMEEIFSTAEVCDTNDSFCNYTYIPHLVAVFEKSRDYHRLESLWKNWRDATGKKLRNHYKVYVDLGNKAARLDNFPDLGALWTDSYESPTFSEDLENIYNRFQPFYQELHAYVRRKLDEEYDDQASINGAIKAHLFGNMWAQEWNTIFDLLKPYSGKTRIDATPTIQEMSVMKMFKMAEEFFTSLGLEPLPELFWKNSILEKPLHRNNIICHASAWDFFLDSDVRIKMCGQQTMKDFITIHHEMGHIQYYMQYKNQHVLFRDGANPGFHEAVGDTLALSVQTPKHLERKKLIHNYIEDKEADINYLMMMALDKIAFLPFALLVDLWRWNVFNGSYHEEEWNKKWWELRCKYQGIIPPVKRSSLDFDPGAKFHVSNDVPYIRYFVSHFVQFQFYQSLCKAANYSGKEYYKCDFFKSKEAGDKLREMLKLGSSKPWQEAIQVISGVNYMDPQPLLDYFNPLYEWLKNQNAKENNSIGWNCSVLKDLLINISDSVQYSLWLIIFSFFINGFIYARNISSL